MVRNLGATSFSVLVQSSSRGCRQDIRQACSYLKAWLGLDGHFVSKFSGMAILRKNLASCWLWVEVPSSLPCGPLLSYLSNFMIWHQASPRTNDPTESKEEVTCFLWPSLETTCHHLCYLLSLEVIHYSPFKERAIKLHLLKAGVSKNLIHFKMNFLFGIIFLNRFIEKLQK